MDRAHAAPDARVGERVPAPAARGRGRAAVSRRAPGAAGARGGEPDARARGPSWRRAARGAGARGRAHGRPRGLVPAPRPRGGRRAAGRGGRQGWHQLQRAPDPWPAHALGELLLERGDELQLALAARAGRDPRLRGGARGRPPRGPRPLAPLLEAARLTQPGLAGARALAAAPRPHSEAVAPRPYSQRKKRTARKIPASAQPPTTAAAAPTSPPPPTIACESPSIRCLSGNASAIPRSTGGRSSLE
jgi:hypothetical protein